jgi:hypothetical protein
MSRRRMIVLQRLFSVEVLRYSQDVGCAQGDAAALRVDPQSRHVDPKGKHLTVRPFAALRVTRLKNGV